MSMFGRIRDRIFGRKPAATPAAAAPAAAPVPTPAPSPEPAPPAPPEPVDVEAVLTDIMAEKGNPNLNWRTSIVDLMKLLDLDSSLANRKELAVELGYKGALDGSADMNIWLHRQVMRALAENGGKVPASFTD